MDIAVVVASNDAYYPLLQGLVASYHDAPRLRSMCSLCVLDLGLSPLHLYDLQTNDCTVVRPGWPGMGKSWPNCPEWFKAMTSRPLLPFYFPGFEIYVWIDADAWIHDESPLLHTIELAKQGSLSIVQERYGTGVTYTSKDSSGATRTCSISRESVIHNVTHCYQRCFGNDIARRLGPIPSYNTGFFALRGDSPTWHIWNSLLMEGLKAGFHPLVEQQALNVAIFRGLVDFTAAPPAANWLCIHEPPVIDVVSRQLLTSNGSGPVGLVHLADLKQLSTLPLQSTASTVIDIPLRYPAFIHWKGSQ